MLCEVKNMSGNILQNVLAFLLQAQHNKKKKLDNLSRNITWLYVQKCLWKF